MKPVILVVEDDQDLLDFLVNILDENHFMVYSATSGAQSLKLVEKKLPDLVILDLGLPDIDGETVCAQIKRDHPKLPVIILTASEDSKDVVKSFDKGADDYIKKPFVNEELLARIKASLRKQHKDNPLITIGDLVLNTNTLEIQRNNTPIELSQTEFKLLHYLMINAEHVLSREQILSHVWSQDPDIETRVVDVYIGYLRKKIDKNYSPKLIHSKRGFGYVLKNPS